jgi:phosphate transport system substrate-binding protein
LKESKQMIAKNRLRKRWLSIALIFAAGLVITLAGCGGRTASDTGLSGSIKVIGSNTVTPLSAVWAEEFMKKNPEVRIAVSGPGSGVGIAALIDGTTDICQSSRPITSSEIDQAKAKGVNPYEIQVATDALSVIVNPANSISELTIAQLSAIYTNKITNWKELGGKDAQIVAMGRDTNSGTHVFFKEHVVQMAGLPTQDKKLEYGSKVLLLPSTEEGVSQVASNPNAIFYAGLAYIDKTVKPLAIKKTPGDSAVLPSAKTALDGTYPISRPLLFYINGMPTGAIKAFIDYCLSPEGQQKVSEVGFVPLAKK